ncbi:MAG: hypothetical protein ABIE68_04800 [bacterium]
MTKEKHKSAASAVFIAVVITVLVCGAAFYAWSKLSISDIESEVVDRYNTINSQVTTLQKRVDSIAEEKENIVEKEIVTEMETTEYDYTNWETYTNDEFGYSFKYPSEYNLNTNNLPTSVLVTGPEIENEGQKDYWPNVSVTHTDSDLYHPPEGVEIAAWVSGQPHDTQKDNTTIAGLTAAHFIDERSPQAYGADYYYFAKDGQLFMMSFLHAADYTDWIFYNQFLQGFSFAQ